MATKKRQRKRKTPQSDAPKQTFTVHYSFYMSESIDIEAETAQEAEEIVEGMISAGELAKDLNKMEIGDSKVWVD